MALSYKKLWKLLIDKDMKKKEKCIQKRRRNIFIVNLIIR